MQSRSRAYKGAIALLYRHLEWYCDVYNSLDNRRVHVTNTRHSLSSCQRNRGIPCSSVTFHETYLAAIGSIPVSQGCPFDIRDCTNIIVVNVLTLYCRFEYQVFILSH